IGIQPDVVIARADEPIDDDLREKIALFCDVKLDNVISEPDAWSIYGVPLMLEEAGLGRIVVEELGLTAAKEPDLTGGKAPHTRICRARPEGAQGGPRPDPRSAHPADDRPRRQIHRASGRVPLGRGGGAPRRVGG